MPALTPISTAAFRSCSRATAAIENHWGGQACKVAAAQCPSTIPIAPMDKAIDQFPAAAESAAPRLKLHIPPHHPAPGERPDFSYVRRYAAGVTERPDVAVPAQATHELAYHLIRVLDDDGAAVG